VILIPDDDLDFDVDDVSVDDTASRMFTTTTGRC